MARTTRKDRRIRRHRRVRTKVVGTALKPRVAVFRSNKHFYVQVIDDEKGTVLAAVSDRNIKSKKRGVELAKEVAKLVSQHIVERKLKRAVFDRGGYAYHGQIKALAEEMRTQGIQL